VLGELELVFFDIFFEISDEFVDFQFLQRIPVPNTPNLLNTDLLLHLSQLLTPPLVPLLPLNKPHPHPSHHLKQHKQQPPILIQFPLIPRTSDQVPYLFTFLQNQFPELLAFDLPLTTGVNDGDGLGEVRQVGKLAEG
jgi:hypothetical protein